MNKKKKLALFIKLATSDDYRDLEIAFSLYPERVSLKILYKLQKKNINVGANIHKSSKIYPKFFGYLRDMEIANKKMMSVVVKVVIIIYTLTLLIIIAIK